MKWGTVVTCAQNPLSSPAGWGLAHHACQRIGILVFNNCLGIVILWHLTTNRVEIYIRCQLLPNRLSQNLTVYRKKHSLSQLLRVGHLGSTLLRRLWFSISHKATEMASGGTAVASTVDSGWIWFYLTLEAVARCLLVVDQCFAMWVSPQSGTQYGCVISLAWGLQEREQGKTGPKMKATVFL